ncbi:hypothetical protein [Escherichia coli]|uniref:hypothetical protein n=1 Tax=Escherichia coli TaxID=562 RepID=UPI003D64C8A9
MTLEESLAVIGQQSSNKRLADVLNQVRSAILEGHPLQMHYSISHAFRFAHRTLVKAGEKAVCWPRCWKSWLITMKTGRKSAASSFVTDLPCMLTTVAIVVVIILLTAVVPKITEQFVHMKQQLPLSTRIL